MIIKPKSTSPKIVQNHPANKTRMIQESLILKARNIVLEDIKKFLHQDAKSKKMKEQHATFMEMFK